MVGEASTTDDRAQRAPIADGRGRGSTSAATDRGQAYTLEGTAAAAIVLLAVFVTTQSMPLTPEHTASSDRHDEALLEQELHDSLVVASNASTQPGDLSALIRTWDGTQFSSLDSFVLGELLAAQFPAKDHRVTFAFESENGSISRETAYETTADESGVDAVSASSSVIVFESEARSSESPIPTRSETMGPVEAVVEVEVTVW